MTVTPFQSEIIPKKQKQCDMSCDSEQTNCEDFMYESEEYKIISRSAPNQVAKSYLENYIKEKNKETTGQQAIPIFKVMNLHQHHNFGKFNNK